MNKQRGEMSVKITVALVVLILILGLTSYIFYHKYQQAQRIINNPSELGKKEANDLTSKVGKLIALPKDETPTIATVSDVSKVRNQPFFKNAQNGDKLLIYTTARKAILYRPSTNMIIETAPVNVGENPAQAGPSPTLTPTLKK